MKKTILFPVPVLFLVLTGFFPSPVSHAQGGIVIEGGAPQKIRIAVPLARIPSGAPADLRERAREIREAILFDLEFSGFFQPIANDELVARVDAKDSQTGRINFTDWTEIGAEALVRYEFTATGNAFELSYWIYNVAAQQHVGGRKIRGAEGNRPREAAHKASNDAIQRLTGRPGIAETKIAFVYTRGRTKELYLMEYDGHSSGIQRLTRDESLCLFPSWHPSGKGIAFTSYINQNPDLFMLDFEKKRRINLSLFPGLNYGASFHPQNPEQMVLTLSKDGNPEIYAIDLSRKRAQRLTRDPGVDCSPCYSPNGQQIVFTSGRTGAPHLFIMNADGSNQRQLTRHRHEDAPDWSPDGRYIVFAGRKPTGGEFDICIIRPDGSGFQRLTEGPGNNQSPSFAPNSRHIVFSSNRSGRFQLYALDLLNPGTVRRLTWLEGECAAPAWSPN